MEKGLLEKTGKPLDHWIKVVRQSKIEKHLEIINFLKAEYDFSYGFANFVALKTNKSDATSIADIDLLSIQYKGKEELKSIYEKLVAEIKKFGCDITVTPKKDSVSIIRKKQFALTKPATKTRIDLGLKFKDKPTTSRLQDSGSFGSMCTHRVVLKTTAEVNSELLGWLKEAYDGAN
ncbi:MAG: DUF4287 domain-containing protein [Saprospiraceae bacterium]|nr:DUF4287 domain-containing protein [Saprospiraceae bacterium]MBK9632261.1 DUF4287 domain-containing protein [Saprospiraceae bacterium]